MAITYIGVSANAAAASGDLTVTPPATQTADIMICAVSTHDNIVLTFPAGWTKYQELNNGTVLRSTLAWKRCVGAEAAFTITHTAGDGIVANVIVFRGCIATESPIHASSMQANASSSTCTAASISTTVTNTMILFTMHDSDNGASSAQTCTDPGALTERFDNSSTLGLDQAVSGAQAAKTSIGATGNATGTLSLGPDVNNGGLTALKPSAETKTKTYTLAARLVSRKPKTYTLAARLVSRLTKTYTLSARLFKTLPKTYTLATRLLKTQTTTYTLAAKLFVLYKTKTFTLAARLIKTQALTYTVTAKLVKRLVKTYTLAVRLLQTRVKTFSLAARLIGQFTKTYSLSARLIAQLKTTYIIGARLRKTQEKTYTLAARLVKINTKTYSLATKLVAIKSKTYSLAVRLIKQRTKDYTIGGKLTRTELTTYTIGIYLIAEYFWELEKRVKQLEAEIAALQARRTFSV